ncbi:MAG: SMC-Scp complex subunit ScpB [Bdellovibrionaceae bacterium]|nr:SMC-Scp complex subunit ScpB [Pseudobdellovibrionaceae bacterium]
MAKRRSKEVEAELSDEMNVETELSEEIQIEEVSMDEESFMAVEAEEEAPAFLPEEDENSLSEEDLQLEASEPQVDMEGTELDSFEAAEIEETEFIEEEHLESIIESILFASDRPVGMGSLKMVFKGTNVRTDKIKRALDRLAVEYAGARRGVTLEEVPGGWQIRTKVDNMEFLRRTLKTRTFRLSGPALEVLSIVAYKQPLVKSEIDEIRGVESGHLLRALMEKNLVTFGGKSDLPGRPMLYETTRKFLEIFGLRNLKELPTLSQIDELLPEGIGEEDEKKQSLSEVTDNMSQDVALGSYSAGEEELEKIQSQLEQISVSSDFFEQEKRRQREQKDKDRAQNIRDALAVDEEVPTRDLNWLKKYDEAIAAGTTLVTLEEAARAARLEAMKKPAAEKGDGVGGAEESVDESVEASSVEESAEASGEETTGEDEPSLFEEEAAHPEDELGYEMADIDSDESENEGDANL